MVVELGSRESITHEATAEVEEAQRKVRDRTMDVMANLADLRHPPPAYEPTTQVKIRV